MSIPVHSAPTAVGVFQSHFGTPPGAQDAKKECQHWQQLCDELLAERARLKTELERRRFLEFVNEPLPNITMEEMYAQVDRTQSIDEFIAETKAELEKGS